MLAFLDFSIQLWGGVDSSGQVTDEILPQDPAATTSVYDVEAGAEFFLTVKVRDRSTDRELAAGRQSAGVIALPVDLEWNQAATNDAAIAYIGDLPKVFPDLIDLENLIVTKSLPRQRYIQTPLNIDAGGSGLRGATIPDSGDGGAPIGKADFSEFSRLGFRANGIGTTDFRVSLTDSMSFADAAVLDNPDDAEAAIVIQVTADNSNSLSGFVYKDDNQDGIRQAGELGIPGVAISLLRNGETVLLQETTTGPDGWYHFEDLVNGAYTLRETQPSCFLDGVESVGRVLPSGEQRGTPDDDGTSDDFIRDIQLDGTEHGIEYNFGELGLVCVTKRLLLAKTPPVREVVADRIGLTSDTIEGTDSADRIVVTLGSQQVTVAVNDGPAETFAEDIVWIDGKDGDDRIEIAATDAEDTAHMVGGYCTVRSSGGAYGGSNYAVQAYNIEEHIVDGAGGTDLAVIEDSAADDLFTAIGNEAKIDWGPVIAGPGIGRLARAVNFARVRAVSSLGGDDRMLREATAYELALIGPWQAG